MRDGVIRHKVIETGTENYADVSFDAFCRLMGLDPKAGHITLSLTTSGGKKNISIGRPATGGLRFKTVTKERVPQKGGTDA